MGTSMQQLTLLFSGKRTPREAPSVNPERPGELASWLEQRLGKPVRLTFTQNRRTMLSYRERGQRLSVRLHRLFVQAGPAEMEALVRYLAEDDREASRALDEFIASSAWSAPVHSIKTRPVGRFHDLQAIFDAHNTRYFHGACQARITWGHSSGRRRRRTIQLGCYVHEERLIRMHPSLDQAFVPSHYVAWVVFHEMLHEVFGREQRRGRRVVHPPEFVALEETYPDYARCKAWEAENLWRLLRYTPVSRGAGAR